MQQLGRSIETVTGRIGSGNVIFGNRLLDGLPREILAHLGLRLRSVFLHRGTSLTDDGDALYFPVDALISTLIHTTGTERACALSTIGRRGIVDAGQPYFGPSIAVQTTVLSSGNAWRIARAAVEARVIPPLQRLLRRHERALFAVATARLACNAEHNVDRRVARWLLFVSDETGKPQAELTHQQLAEIAAIRRPSVSLAFADLARRGIVNGHHGLVQILDRERLEREACPCYQVIRDLLDAAARDA